MSLEEAVNGDCAARSKDEDSEIVGASDEAGMEAQNSAELEETKVMIVGVVDVLKTDVVSVALGNAVLVVWAANVGVTDV